MVPLEVAVAVAVAVAVDERRTKEEKRKGPDKAEWSHFRLSFLILKIKKKNFFFLCLFYLNQ